MNRHGLQRRGIGRFVGVGALAFGVLFAAQPAAAQTALRVDASAGYLSVGSMSGWYAQVSAPTSAGFSLVGQFDVSNGPECARCRPDYHDKALLFGARFGGSRARISPFVQVLGGVLQSKRDSYYYDTVVGYDPASKQWIEGKQYSGEYQYDYMVLQPGAGLMLMLTQHVGIRAGGDFQFAFHEEGVSMFPRLVAGGVIRFGTR